jgi:hypothetical protein
LETIPSYFNSMIETVIYRQEDEAFENLDHHLNSPSVVIDVEKLLRKAKIDCLNILGIGANTSRLEYARKFKILSINNAFNY